MEKLIPASVSIVALRRITFTGMGVRTVFRIAGGTPVLPRIQDSALSILSPVLTAVTNASTRVDNG
jgi:hypothetical protein